MSKTKDAHIHLYSDDFDSDVWEDYCEICGVSKDSTIITINFDYKDVKSA